jgi:DNA repair and recombination protein RAD52
VESWKVIELANSIFGFNGWSSSIVDITPDFIEESQGRFRVGVTAVVKVSLKDGTSHEDVGYGISENKIKGSAIENAKKEAVSDARKRALRLFGNALGNCIYDKDHLNKVKSKVKGNSTGQVGYDQLRSGPPPTAPPTQPAAAPQALNQAVNAAPPQGMAAPQPGMGSVSNTMGPQPGFSTAMSQPNTVPSIPPNTPAAPQPPMVNNGPQGQPRPYVPQQPANTAMGRGAPPNQPAPMGNPPMPARPPQPNAAPTTVPMNNRGPYNQPPMGNPPPQPNPQQFVPNQSNNTVSEYGMALTASEEYALTHMDDEQFNAPPNNAPPQNYQISPNPPYAAYTPTIDGSPPDKKRRL